MQITNLADASILRTKRAWNMSLFNMIDALFFATYGPRGLGTDGLFGHHWRPRARAPRPPPSLPERALQGR
jgi:hypothetical protein